MGADDWEAGAAGFEAVSAMLPIVYCLLFVVCVVLLSKLLKLIENATST